MHIKFPNVIFFKYLSLVSSEDSEGFDVLSDFVSVTVLDLTSVGVFSGSWTGVLEGVWPVALDITWVPAGVLLSEEVLSSGGDVWGCKMKF